MSTCTSYQDAMAWTNEEWSPELEKIPPRTPPSADDVLKHKNLLNDWFVDGNPVVRFTSALDAGYKVWYPVSYPIVVGLIIISLAFFLVCYLLCPGYFIILICIEIVLKLKKHVIMQLLHLYMFVCALLFS